MNSAAQPSPPTKSPVGVKVAVDPGSVRVGIARSDSSGVLAFPVMSAQRGTDDIQAVRSLIDEFAVTAVYVGLPLSLSGADTASTALAREYALSLASHFPQVQVRLVDERLTTVTAAASMHAAGKDARTQRKNIDAAAAAVLLQHVLDAESRGGVAVGELVDASAGAAHE